MIGKIVSALAGRSVARTLSGPSAGPTGALIGAALPIVLPGLMRTLGPFGMVAAAVGGIFLSRYMERRSQRQLAPLPLRPLPPKPAAMLSSPATPQPAYTGAIPHGSTAN